MRLVQSDYIALCNIATTPVVCGVFSGLALSWPAALSKLTLSRLGNIKECI